MTKPKLYFTDKEPEDINDLEFDFISGDTITADSITGDTITANNFNSVSDINLKENINKLNISIHEILKLSPVEFNWKGDNNKNINYGFIAQEVEKIFPELIQNMQDGTKAINYYGIITILFLAVKEQQKTIEEMYDEINRLYQLS
jgi:hypothetical protein